MLSVFLGVVGTYVATTCLLATKRALKIVELHEEYQFIRSRAKISH